MGETVRKWIKVEHYLLHQIAQFEDVVTAFHQLFWNFVCLWLPRLCQSLYSELRSWIQFQHPCWSWNCKTELHYLLVWKWNCTVYTEHLLAPNCYIFQKNRIWNYPVFQEIVFKREHIFHTQHFSLVMILSKHICEMKRFRMILRFSHTKKKFAPGEARTHGLQIMRLTRCLLRYRGLFTYYF